ncbi:PAS domain S-box-containing protein [Prosthecobacter fusiformis]|uniref:histidine kinase n=1 Tax=Prosthecobacter fusiformis TaxID=48464 RepID=A0A4R7S741_9BACT|nr:PAS domain S-box protein [Prosthecobacter fusiformis]TDU73037.1 PAS domain S-box-containing protein [Prosthecobacter fusiformis]
MKAPIPEDEEERLAVLREYEILDTMEEAAFNELTELAAHICRTPMAAISLIDRDRQWFKAQIGMDEKETPRDLAFCAHAIMTKDRVMIVNDASQDERFVDHPMVSGDPSIRFYAGAPLLARGNQPLGTLCVIGREPQELTLSQTAALNALSRNVVAQMELRIHSQRLRQEVTEKGRIAEQLQEQNEQLIRSEKETGRLLELAEKSRNALLSVLEDEQRLARELRRWADAFENCAQGILICTPANESIFACNSALASLHGQPADEIAGLTLLSLFAPGNQLKVQQFIHEADESGQVRFELPMLRANGSSYDAQVDLVSVRDAEGEPLYWVVTIQDISARKTADLLLARTNRALKLMSACNESLVHATDEQHLLAEVCRLAVDIGGYRLAWVGYALHDEAHSIRPMANAGHEAGYLSEISLSWSEFAATGRGPAARSIRSGQMVICQDIEAESEGFFWKEAALSRGYRSIICLPLRDENRTFGLLALYASEVQEVGQDEIKLLQEMAEDLAFGIRHLRSRQERQRMQDVVLKVSQAVSAGHGEDFFQSLTRNMVEALDADGGVIGRLDPEKRQSIETRALFLHGQFQENISYILPGTPCEGVSLGYTSIFESSVQSQFPEDLWLKGHGIEAYAGIPLLDTQMRVNGIMAVFYRKPLEQVSLVHSTLKIFAARVADELERQEADERIREQASLLDKAQDAILVRDLNHRVTYWNKSAEALYGWSAEEVLGKPVTDVFYQETMAFNAAIQQLFEEGEWVGELDQFSKDGTPLTIECRWTMVNDSAGKPKSVLCINTDITEKKKLEQQFLRAQRMESIGTLAGGIAHDLNNVLAPIMMAIDLLKMTVTSQSGQDILSTISQSAQRGADMVNQVLSFARGMEGRRMEVYAHALIRDIEKIARDTFPKNIQIFTQYEDGLWPVVGDPTQLHQVLLNLCVNARDAMPDGGSIVVSASNERLDESYAAMHLEAQPGPYLKIQVKDTGTGIPQAIIEQIFDPFFTTKELGKGTGLGLSTSLAIVKSHGGFIQVESEGGRGSQFRLYLPAFETSGTVAEESRIEEMPRGRGETVLVVDDEKTIREITQQTLEAFGYKALLAADGAEAVTLYAQHRASVSIVLTDMMMPVMDGPATIKVLRNINPSLKIIAASGISTNEAVTKAAGQGVKHFVSKPYTAESLLRVLRECLDGEG